MRNISDSNFLCKHIATVNERKSKMMSAKKAGILAVIANEQCPELIHPNETTFTAETLFVDGRVEEAFAPLFRLFALALVLADVGNDVGLKQTLRASSVSKALSALK